MATAQTATIKGKVFDTEGNPIENVSISFENKGTTTNSQGEYSLNIPSDKVINIIFSHISYKNYTKRIRISNKKTLNFSPKLQIKNEEIEEVVLINEKKNAEGITTVKTEIT
ncbi:MAG: carboxypeptidase-like regulatory domain-containing protein, partial [Flavobacteriaceae bacterium]|nr:carboxypeptidase-like regulatory domain-containing protein [Flavobacteriaceae bacterium]